jgi:phosphatidylserine/phosphatidylglycerophosphate/cardiolipin synthase-like enzyme
MKRLLLAFGLVFACLVPACHAQDTSQPTTLPPVQVFFSPKGGCTEAVVKELSAAKTSVLVQAYSFTSAPVAKALLAAHKRGVKVEVVLDKSQRTEKYSEADFLVNVGIPVRIDDRHAIGRPTATTRRARTGGRDTTWRMPGGGNGERELPAYGPSSRGMT